MQTELKEPERIAKLPHYKGLPVSATTFINDDGTPNFRSIDGEKVWQLKKEHKCGICGEPLDYWIAFMVTEEEAKSRIIYESPQHLDCLKYAFQICPWLFYTKAKYSDLESIDAIEGIRYESVHPDRDATNERPSKLGIYLCRSYENIIHNRRYRVCKVPAAKSIEWIEGH